MTVQEQLDRLTQIAATALESIQALERVTAKHTEQIGVISQAVNSLADTVNTHDKQMQQLLREWQAYLRTIHPRQ